MIKLLYEKVSTTKNIRNSVSYMIIDLSLTKNFMILVIRFKFKTYKLIISLINIDTIFLFIVSSTYVRYVLAFKTVFFFLEAHSFHKDQNNVSYSLYYMYLYKSHFFNLPEYNIWFHKLRSDFLII